MGLEEPLLESQHDDGEGDGLPTWLDPVNDEDHRSLMSGVSGSEGGNNPNETSWADGPLSASRGGEVRRRSSSSSDLPRLILGVRILNIGAAIALITCSVS